MSSVPDQILAEVLRQCIAMGIEQPPKEVTYRIRFVASALWSDQLAREAELTQPTGQSIAELDQQIEQIKAQTYTATKGQYDVLLATIDASAKVTFDANEVGAWERERAQHKLIRARAETLYEERRVRFAEQEAK